MAGVEWKRFFWRWVLGWAVLGLMVPVGLMIGPFVFGRSVGLWSVWLWPSSLIFGALNALDPASLPVIAVLYALALILNILLYAGLSIVLWPIADSVRRRVLAGAKA